MLTKELTLMLSMLAIGFAIACFMIGLSVMCAVESHRLFLQEVRHVD